ncbi:MAG: glutamine synthetase, partial [Candidatus Aenigmarchaeota archaeon ex4484_14]
IRVPNTFGDWKKTRIEYRSTDPLCNPYLTFAVQLWAGLDGIEKEMEPPEIFRGNIYELSEKEIEEAGIEILPRSLGEALKEMKNDLVVKEALGKHMFDEYIKAKKNEIDAFNKYVTDWEIDKYFDM